MVEKGAVREDGIVHVAVNQARAWQMAQVRIDRVCQIPEPEGRLGPPLHHVGRVERLDRADIHPEIPEQILPDAIRVERARDHLAAKIVP